MSTHTVTKYAVARGQKIIGTHFDTVEGAQAELTHYEGLMTQAALEPDVRLVQFDVTTTTGHPKAYREPEPEVTETIAEAPEQVEPNA